MQIQFSPLDGGIGKKVAESSSSLNPSALSSCAMQRPAFSKDDLLPMDLGTFYREFQNPPQLTSLSLHISSQSMAEDLVTQTASISHSHFLPLIRLTSFGFCVALGRTRCRRNWPFTRRTSMSLTPSWTCFSRMKRRRRRQ